ncbi:hypothetical protein [Ruegeria arenilitoris]|uniref:hypothetical protein n=1 Tax=Ruegeria arenilitoris TaxID=1173585 RepID=UPI00147C86A9|nr:hypothetical protein [Ruegeria arenilitoris]
MTDAARSTDGGYAQKADFAKSCVQVATEVYFLSIPGLCTGPDQKMFFVYEALVSSETLQDLLVIWRIFREVIRRIRR